GGGGLATGPKRKAGPAGTDRGTKRPARGGVGGGVEARDFNQQPPEENQQKLQLNQQMLEELKAAREADAEREHSKSWKTH
ncbi:hypothetical protein DFQ27_006476, partial [Actinomortierella ambigua]